MSDFIRFLVYNVELSILLIGVGAVLSLYIIRRLKRVKGFGIEAEFGDRDKAKFFIKK